MTSPNEHPAFAVTVDLVVFTLRSRALHILLVTRGEAPFAGRLALPGGFVHPDEDLETAALRELREETAIEHPAGTLEQLRSYGAPDRDPRQRVVSVAHLALTPDLPEATGGSDAADASWVPIEEALAQPLAFDHDQILSDGLERARAKLEYTNLATAFCPTEFTISDLRTVYEAIWGHPLDPRNFHRKLTSTPGLLIDTGKTRKDGPGRPATVYRAGETSVLNPPINREG